MTLVRYVLESRIDVHGPLCVRHLSLQHFCVPAPPSLHRVPRGRFPCFIGTMRHSDSLTPFPRRFVSFARRYRPASLFRSLQPRDARCRGPGDFSGSPPVPLSPVLWDGNVRVSQVPREPHVHMPCSWTPEGPAKPGLFGSADTAFRNYDGVGSLNKTDFGALSHGLRTRCLRLAGWITPPPPMTRFRLLACFAGRGWLPAGFHYKVSGGSLAIRPPRPGFAWRNIITVDHVLAHHGFHPL